MKKIKAFLKAVRKAIMKAVVKAAKDEATEILINEVFPEIDKMADQAFKQLKGKRRNFDNMAILLKSQYKGVVINYIQNGGNDVDK
jgi:ribosomal protein S20